MCRGSRSDVTAKGNTMSLSTQAATRRGLSIGAAMALGTAGFGLLVFGPRREAANAQAPSPPVDARIQLTAPYLTAGEVADLNRPDLLRWRGSGEYYRILEGRIAIPGQLHVRPWLYTDCWIPQPVVAVEPDGRFQARVYFGSAYDAPMVICLEVEDRSLGQVVASQDYFLKLESTGAPQ